MWAARLTYTLRYDCPNDTTGAQRTLSLRFRSQIQTLLSREGRQKGRGCCAAAKAAAEAPAQSAEAVTSKTPRTTNAENGSALESGFHAWLRPADENATKGRWRLNQGTRNWNRNLKPTNRSQAVLAHIRPAHKDARARIEHDSLVAAVRADNLRDFVPPLNQRGSNRFRHGAFNRQTVVPVTDPCSFTGLLHVHPEIDHVDEHLRVPLCLMIAAHHAKRQKRIAIFQRKRGNQRMQRPLVRTDLIW